MIFHVVVCTTLKEPCYLGPFVAIHVILLENNFLFLRIDRVSLDVRVYVIVVPNGRVNLIW